MRKRRAGPQELCRRRKRGNLRDRFLPRSGTGRPVAQQRVWRQRGSRCVGPKCSRDGYREFRCGYDSCQRWARICSCCDRGHRYCGERCARAARQGSQRKSRRKYEQTARARLLRAERQRRYRTRVLEAAAQQQQPEVRESDLDAPAPIHDSGADNEQTRDAAASGSGSPDRMDPQKVTHQGSLGSACVSQWRASRIASLGPGLFPVRCSFCGAWCRPERRRGPLRGRQRRRIHPFPGR